MQNSNAFALLQKERSKRDLLRVYFSLINILIVVKKRWIAALIYGLIYFFGAYVLPIKLESYWGVPDSQRIKTDLLPILPISWWILTFWAISSQSVDLWRVGRQKLKQLDQRIAEIRAFIKRDYDTNKNGTLIKAA